MNFFSFRKCRIVPKNVEGGLCLTLWALLTYIMLQNKKKFERGILLIHQKNFEKMLHNVEKNRKGDLLVSSGFVGYGKIVKKERGALLH